MAGGSFEAKRVFRQKKGAFLKKSIRERVGTFWPHKLLSRRLGLSGLSHEGRKSAQNKRPAVQLQASRAGGRQGVPAAIVQTLSPP